MHLVKCPLAGLHLGWSHKQGLKADPKFYVESEHGFVFFDWLQSTPKPTQIRFQS